MTKVTILGQEPAKSRIVFEGFLNVQYEVRLITSLLEPEEWDEITLLSRGYKEGKYDLMFAKGREHDPEETCLYVGYFNDGVV